MKRAVIVGCGMLGLMAANCSAPAFPDADGFGDDSARGAGGRGGATTGSGARGGTGGTFGGGGAFGGSGGSLIGTGGRAGGSVDGGAFNGVYNEQLVEAEDSPPPLSGGTLTIIGQGHRAAVSDPDHDQIVTVDLDAMTVLGTTPLARGDEPNRSAEDGSGRLHVVLRGGRGVAVVDPVHHTVLGRLPVCVHPRGIAYDTARDAIHVACAGGELVSYAATDGVLLRKVRLQRDLRDVVVDGNRLLVSRFRAAELLVVESNGTVSATLKPEAPNVPGGGVNAVAWRTVPSPDGGALMVYQTLRTGFVPTTPGGYGGGVCGGGIITTSVSLLRVGQAGFTMMHVPAVLPIDLATNPARLVSVASAAWTPNGVNRNIGPFFTFPAPQLGPNHVTSSVGFCGGPVGPIPPPAPPAPMFDGGAADEDPADLIPTVPPPPPPPPVDGGLVPGRVIALGYAGSLLVLQTREPATLVAGGRSVELPGRSRKHTGHELFHLGTVGGIACASCHPEGGEDGQVWTFSGLGQRRTQNVSGGISGTEPFHWSGDMETFDKLAHDVFQARMSGPKLDEEYVGALFRWIDKIPAMAPPTPEDPGAVERGKAIFNHADVACATCHSGERLTNNGSFDVKTGAAFQVPSLRGLAWRAPYMHTGCAPTLDARFDSCGGGDAHGHTSQLTAEQRADLVAYLDSL
jgi:hypothetical protein